MSLQIRILNNNIDKQEDAFTYLQDFSVGEGLVYQTLRSVLLNLRSGNAHTKNRGEVRGGGKKPWKQKGTGRARHGSSRSPIWVGGGVTFGSRNTRNWHRKINKTAKNSTLKALIKERLLANSVFQFESSYDCTKTKNALSILDSLKENLKLKKTFLVIVYSDSDKGKLNGFTNIKEAKLMNVNNIKLNWVAQTPNIIFTIDAKVFLEEKLKLNK
jgi:large subunit ribosomal protein L4